MLPNPSGRADYIVEVSREREAWEQSRMAHLCENRIGAPVACGLYACSPKGRGYAAEFSFLRIDAGRVA
ncbi:MAG TPA: DUF1349 domain-containing protein [Chthoniobacterales bacterium]